MRRHIIEHLLRTRPRPHQLETASSPVSICTFVPVKLALSPTRSLACTHYTLAAAHELKAAAAASVFVLLYE